ncbi:replication factor A protein 2 [Monosporozyma unispora]|nr:replication factor A protein 2 [Kazachstania unispora]
MSTYQPYSEYSNNNSGGFETNNDSRPSTGDAPPKKSTCTPVTIKQILESTQDLQDGSYFSHGHELLTVAFVGVVRNITDNTSNIMLTVEDGTGQIDIKKYSNNVQDLPDAGDMADSDPNNVGSSQLAQEYEIGTYVKIHGALREFTGKKNIQYSVITKIDSFNEVLTHHLEAIKWHAIALGKLPNPTNQEATGLNSSNGQSLFVKDNETTTTASNNATSGGSGEASDKILAFCRKECAGKDSNNFAVPIQLLAQHLSLDEETVRTCCTTLTEQGFLYPTFDDDNYFAL